jgi:hypothetical protein
MPGESSARRASSLSKAGAWSSWLEGVDLARLVALAAMWGASYLFMRYAVPHFGPVLMIEGRVLIAGIALVAFVLASGGALDWRDHWRAYLFVGVIGLDVPFLLIAEALTTIDASTAAILNALVPFSPRWSRPCGFAIRSRPEDDGHRAMPSRHRGAGRLAAGADGPRGAPRRELLDRCDRALRLHDGLHEGALEAGEPDGDRRGHPSAGRGRARAYRAGACTRPHRRAADGLARVTGIGVRVDDGGVHLLLPPDCRCRSREGEHRDAPGARLRNALGRALPRRALTAGRLAGCAIILSGCALVLGLVRLPARLPT